MGMMAAMNQGAVKAMRSGRKITLRTHMIKSDIISGKC